MPPEQPDADLGGARIRSLAVSGFNALEQSLLIIIALLTIGAVAREIYLVFATQTVTLADILQMFLYTEVIGMVGVFYTGHGFASPFAYPIFIAITALARLIVLQGKDMKPENILFEAGAILLLAVAVMIILRPRQQAAG
ncbi:phosphate-starvation-inducible PsiE family protein [Sphingomonas sp.]|uniref:phosphate-starvation-inducible protein PsiE n=1 Tax=Sphingomonas sp. TaxID=28214 RepID=UPI001DCD3792|nr:phosphate-starvation-inducible PsiE family protein [Sphingomonas sp.]MBX9796174.1 phosphate-starvation-inducible PsiE family protein [Sphingomonas sp.]